MRNLCILFIALAFILVGCSKNEEVRINGISYKIRANNNVTKTSLSGNKLSWASQDALGFYAGNIQENVKFLYTGNDIFTGSLTKHDYPKSQTNYCCYYPYNSLFSGSIVFSALQRRQLAPFDATLDYVVSDKISEVYDESHYPDLSFILSNHLFAIAHIQVINSGNSDLTNEKIKNVVLKTSGNQIVGDFCFDVLDGEETDPVFNGGNSCDSAIVAFSPTGCPNIGLNKITDFYVIMNEGTYSSIKLTVNTNGHRAELYSTTSTTFSRGCITTLPMVDLSEVLLTQTEKYTYDAYIIGDSILRYWLNNNVFYFTSNHYSASGIPGETTTQMLARFKTVASSTDHHCFVLMGGTNDIAQNQGYISNEDILANMIEMCEIAKKNGMHPMICSVLPVSQYSWNPSIVPMPIIQDLNSKIKAYCDTTNTIYVDMYSYWVNDTNTGPKEGLTTDSVHPTSEGYRLLESILDPYIAEVNYSY